MEIMSIEAITLTVLVSIIVALIAVIQGQRVYIRKLTAEINHITVRMDALIARQKRWKDE